MARADLIDAVVTTLDIIERMAQAGRPVGISELANATGVPKARIYRHLRTLVGRGFVTQEPLTEKYRLSLRLFHIGTAITEQTELLVEARTVMSDLRERVDQSVVIGQIEENGVRVADILRHQSAVEISARPGALFDFHCTAQGKVALAFGPPLLWERLRAGPLRKWTAATTTSLGRLRAEVARVSKQGWAVAPGEVMSGINALAAPIFDATGMLAGTLGILGSIQHVAPRPAPQLVRAVVEAAAELSSRLGFRKVAA